MNPPGNAREGVQPKLLPQFAWTEAECGSTTEAFMDATTHQFKIVFTRCTATDRLSPNDAVVLFSVKGDCVEYSRTYERTLH